MMFLKFLKIYFFYLILCILKLIKDKIINLKNAISTKNNYQNFREFNDYLKEVKIFNKSKKISKNKILVTDFLSTPGYTHTSGVIGKYLVKTINGKIDGFIRQGDFRSRKILESFGTDKIYNLDQHSLIMTLDSFFTATKLFLKVKSIDEFIKIKLNKVNIGMIVYDHILRHGRTGTFDKFSFKYIYYLALAINVDKVCKNIFKTKYKYAVILETQFIPNSIIFENALLNKCKVISHEGGSDKFTVRIYRNFKERFQSKIRFPKNIFNRLQKSKRKKFYENEGNKLILKKMKINQIDQNDWDGKKDQITKKKICDIYNFDPKKPLIGVFAHDFIDGNFINSGRVFRDKYSWFIKTLDFASKHKNVNWIIKDHPTDHTKPPKTTGKTTYDNLYKNSENIKLLPTQIKSKDLLTSVDLVLTCSGSVGIEFPCFGVKSMIACNTYYSGFGFINPSKNESSYFKEIKNTIKNRNFKMLDTKIKKANIYAYLLYHVGINKCPIIPKFNWSRKKFKEKQFWKDSYRLMKKYDAKNDTFLKKLSHQIDKDHTHMLNPF